LWWWHNGLCHTWWHILVPVVDGVKYEVFMSFSLRKSKFHWSILEQWTFRINVLSLCVTDYCKEIVKYEELIKWIFIGTSSKEYIPTYFLYFLNSYLFETIYLCYSRGPMYSLSRHNIITSSMEKKIYIYRFQKVFLNKHFSWKWWQRGYIWHVPPSAELVISAASSALLAHCVTIILSSYIFLYREICKKKITLNQYISC
jgi:hypothetical protein